MACVVHDMGDAVGAKSFILVFFERGLRQLIKYKPLTKNNEKIIIYWNDVLCEFWCV